MALIKRRDLVQLNPLLLTGRSFVYAPTFNQCQLKYFAENIVAALPNYRGSARRACPPLTFGLSDALTSRPYPAVTSSLQYAVTFFFSPLTTH